jgi:cytochrome oxidase Cu insertion factor (SCO1/SenC/PrrC family)
MRAVRLCAAILSLALAACNRGASSTPEPRADAPPGSSPTIDLKVGDPAPPFELPGSDGKVHKLADYKGKAVVLAWFAKAFTTP